MTTLFDHLKHIYTDQTVSYWDTLPDVDKKTYSTYMINRLVSMTSQYVEVVNLVQMYELLAPRESYLYFSQLLPKKNPWSKYIKSTKDKSTTPEWLVELVARHFTVSQYVARDYITLMLRNDLGKEELRTICEQYGTDPKLIKKAKL